MKKRVRWAVVLILLLVGVLFSIEQIVLVTGLPKPPVQRIMMQGKHWVTRPIVDKNKNVFLLWRVISGAVYKELVTSVYFQKLSSAGRPIWGGIPKVPAQVMHSIADRSQGGDASGAAPDGKGGVYYLWASYLLHFNAEGINTWPKGKMVRRRSHILWRRPSAVRYLKSKRLPVRQVSLAADGMGNALVFWRARDSYRVNKITSVGKVLWGKTGIPLVTREETYEKGRGISDGRGGVVALVAYGRYGSKAIVKYYSSSGKLRRKSSVINFSLKDFGQWRIAPDGDGGILILYIKGVFRGMDHLGNRMHLARYNRHGRRVYEKILSPLVHWRNRMSWLSLQVDGKGTALANWRYRSPVHNIDVYFTRVEKNGRQPWGRVLKITKPSTKGSYVNESGKMEMLAIGGRTHLMYELMRDYKGRSTAHLMRQKISSSGGFAIPGLGKSVTPQGGFTAQLFRVGDRPAAIYYDTRKVGYISNHLVPILMFLE